MTEEELLQIIEKAAKEGATRLHLSGYGLTYLPAEIGQLSNLQELYVYNNQLGQLPAEIAQLSNLKLLYLIRNRLNQLPAEIGQLPSLSRLYLSNNQLSELPAEIGQLSNLNELYLSNNQLSELPAEIGQLSNLNELYLSNNQLSELPAEIGQLSNLNWLDLDNNQLSELPAEIGQLSNLNWLDLSNNQLSKLSAEIGQLSNLSVLALDGNQLTELPAAIGQLSNLNVLCLSSNQLTELPAAIGQLSNLIKLYLGENQLSQLPAEMAQLSNLNILVLTSNRLSRFPYEILQLSNLVKLHLTANQLTELPLKIGQLHNLTALSLNSNQLGQVPSEIGQLSELRELNLRNNQLSQLPVEIAQLSNLRELDFRNNPLPIPPEILGPSEWWKNPGDPITILNYYFQLQQEQKRPLNEAKLLLVGQGSVGKTSVVKRLIEGCYNPRERKTEGISIQPWQVQINDQMVRLNVWDFGGQEIMHATHQFFLTKRSLYLLVLDARLGEDENKLEYWLKIIQSFGGDSPIVVVGNKIDQQPLDIDKRGLQNKYKTIRAILEVSCETGQGLKELKEAITYQISQLEHVQDLLPASWFQVKICLEELERDYIPYNDYERICVEQQITDDLSQATLVGLLHDLGIVLNFRSDPRLEDTHVLNPEWVTNAVYKILNDNLLFTQHHAILDRAQLSRILDCNQYPRNKQLFIVNMMQKFELCFPLEGEDRFLIPDLLPKEEPATGEWSHALAFQYHYNILPSSIISRFIVRMHHCADRKTWWRSGIVLKEQNNRALVRADREDKKIFVWISGPPSTRRQLLTSIRNQFKAIHQSIKGIVADEKVPIPNYPDIVVDYQNLLVYEEKGLPIIPEGLTETFDPRQLLDGIEPEPLRRESQRRYPEKAIMTPEPLLEKEVFISYAWKGESEAFVDQLDQAFQAKGITIVRDKRDLGYKGLIKQFMQRIGRGKCVLAVISEKYLKSENCMYELVQIAKNGDFYDRIFPVVLADAQIYKPVERIKYIKHWEEKIQELDEAMKGVSSAYLQGFREEIDQYTDIRNAIAELTNTLKDMNTLTADLHSESDFKELFQAVEQKLAE